MDNAEINEIRYKKSSKGLIGLYNLGNTCYMNAALQCLFATDLLVAYFKGIKINDEYKTAQYKYDLCKNIINKINTNGIYVKTNEMNETNESKYKNTIRKMFKKSLTYKFRKLIEIGFNNNCIIKPVDFKRKISENDIFNGYSQNDSQECLLYILDQIHEETKTDAIVHINEQIISTNVKSMITYITRCKNLMNDPNITEEQKQKITNEINEYTNDNFKSYVIYKSYDYWTEIIKCNHSSIIDIFTGLFSTYIECSVCKNRSVKFDSYNILSLHIPDNNKNEIDLHECLNHSFNKIEHLKDDNKYLCDKCNSSNDALKLTKIWHTPNKLIILLNRYVEKNGQLYKTRKNVKFPLNNLDLTNYVDLHNKNDKLYNLYGVIQHSGGLSGGHYVSYTRNIFNNEWYYFDDEHVLYVEPNELEKKIIDSDSYVLFYEKCKN